VSNVHDLHVWSFGSDRVAMTVHLVADDTAAAVRASQAIANRHGIRHSTIQARVIA
jgi:Co/Zn/Cd efflux system component